MKLSMVAALPFALMASGALAQDYETALTAYYETSARALISAPELIAAAAEANAAHAGIDQAGIDQLDAAWMAEVGASETPTITPILNNAAADYLRAFVASSGGTVLEAFITDAVGLNVAVSAPTSDMWQGDEEKFSKVFPLGPDAVHYGEIELDESTQAYQAQISIPLVDPATNSVIGTITLGMDADALL